jgi:hypothetical protein
VLYRPTFETLSYMGVHNVEELPNYESVSSSLQATINQTTAND